MPYGKLLFMASKSHRINNAPTWVHYTILIFAVLLMDRSSAGLMQEFEVW
ncbi:MAG: hypothetical protein OXN89_00975 [Bryobacterales bacterium]|nr:hypothetical protein [Bryobacterales bacterium]